MDSRMSLLYMDTAIKKFLGINFSGKLIRWTYRSILAGLENVTEKGL